MPELKHLSTDTATITPSQGNEDWDDWTAWLESHEKRDAGNG